MWRHALIAGGIAVLTASAPAIAQDDGVNEDRSMMDRPMMDRDDREADDGRRGPPRERRQDRAGGPPHGHRGAMMGMGEMTTGFVLDLGDDRALRVFCGDESIGTCMEAVRPLIDQVPSLMD